MPQDSVPGPLLRQWVQSQGTCWARCVVLCLLGSSGNPSPAVGVLPCQPLQEMPLQKKVTVPKIEPLPWERPMAGDYEGLALGCL